MKWSRKVALCAVAVVAACDPSPPPPPAALPDADPSRGMEAILEYGCGSCHAIPGIREADAYVAPPLIAFSRRSFIAGELTNDARNLVRWIQNPKTVKPGTPMPDLGVTESDARDIAAYLLTLD